MYPHNFDRTMPIVEPTYQSIDIKPPERNYTSGRIPSRLIIDSADRNTNKFPNVGQYTYMLINEFTEVVAIELAQARIPNTIFNVNSSNNLIYFSEDGETLFRATIAVGNYTSLTTFATAVQTALNSAGGSSTYTVSIDPLTSYMTINSNLTGGTGKFFLQFRECSCPSLICVDPCSTGDDNPPTYMKNSAGILMGFSASNFEADASGNIIGDLLPDLSGIGYVALHLSAGNESHIKNISNNKNLNGSFSIIPLTADFGKPVIINTGTTARMSETKFFNPPLRRVDRLMIKFVDRNGNIVDFNGVNHMIDIEIQTLNSAGRYDTLKSNN
jgi:hypothetical protein